MIKININNANQNLLIHYTNFPFFLHIGFFSTGWKFYPCVDHLLIPNYKGSSILYIASPVQKKYDNDRLKNVGIQIAFQLKDGIDSIMDEDLHNLITKLPVSAFIQKINQHPALIYICDNYHRDVFYHFIFRYQELHPDYNQYSMLLIDEAYEIPDIFSM